MKTTDELNLLHKLRTNAIGAKQKTAVNANWKPQFAQSCHVE